MANLNKMSQENLTGNVLRAPKTVHYFLLLPTNTVVDPGEEPGGPGSPLFLDQTGARRDEKKNDNLTHLSA